jgi:hypothetical protein
MQRSRWNLSRCLGSGRDRVVSRRGAVSLLVVGLSAMGERMAAEVGQPAAPRASYDATVLADKPVAYWAMRSPDVGTEKDLTGHGHQGRYFGEPGAAKLPNGHKAADFTGSSQYLEVPDDAALSPATTGVLTLEAWMRPDALQFPHAEGSGYVHWMGKGEPGHQEYVARMYSTRNEENRPNRISGYLFNASGGKGAGSYFEEKITKGQWIHYVLVINAKATSGDFPNGYTIIYRDGTFKDKDDLNYHGTVIKPTHGKAPFRVGTRDLTSFFEGAVGKVAIYDKELSEKRIREHYRAMNKK